ncbi:MAG: polysaccharide deacetylase family protein [Steroidobacteraceae bacterium]
MPLRLALKIDVDTLRGTREGVPPLMQLLRAEQVGATFLFSLGPDHTGRAIKRAFRPGFLKKVSRTSVLEHYGLKTLMYGVLLPGPHIGRSTGELLRTVSASGFETGIHCYDHVLWQDHVATRDAAWTAKQMHLAADAFQRVFGRRAQVHGAAGWQMNLAALELEEALGFSYASDTRGTTPFRPLLTGRASRCAQLPTTLPTLDELIGVDGITPDNVHEPLLERTLRRQDGHVFTLHAELEGMKLRPVLQKLLLGWKRQGYDIVSMETLSRSLDVERLPVCEVIQGEVPGRSGTLACQGSPRH